MIRCLIIEENLNTVALLTQYLSKFESVELVKVITNTTQSVDIKPQLQIDLAIINTHLSYLGGTDLARNLNFIPQVIFISTNNHHAVEAFELKATDYLLLPLKSERFAQAIATAIERNDLLKKPVKPTAAQQMPANSFWVKSDYSYVKINFDSLLYVEGLKDYLKLHVKGQSKPFLTLGSLKKLEERLPEKDFCRIHRSYIISVNNIDSVQRNLVKIGNAKLSIGDHYKSQFFQNVIENDLV